MRKILITFSMILIVYSLFAVSNETYFKFEVNSKSEINKISRIISIENVFDKTIFAYASINELENFNQLGYQIEILPKPSQRFIPKMADNLDGMRDWDSYPTYETYVEMMYQFANDYPNICSVTSLGQSIEGREILTAKISDNLSVEEDEPEFFYTGQMHGNELVTFIMLLHLIDYITENYGNNARITDLVNNMEIYINPLSNPDGTYAAGNHTVWGATRYNANSVDLNRNFPDPEDGIHPDGNEHQIENIVMMDFAEEHSLVLSSNLHSGAEVVNYPWDTWAQLAADDIWWQEVSRTYADTVHVHSPTNYMTGFENGITNGYAWYSISGGRQDYMNYFHNCREMTLELSDVMLVPEDELEAHWQYNRQSMILYMEECLYGIRGIVTDEMGEPIEAKVKALGHDFDNSEVFCDPDVGDYHRLIAAGNYDLQFSSYGYVTEQVDNIQVEDNAITIQNIVLQNALQFSISGIITDASNNEPIENAEIEVLGTPLEIQTSNEFGEYSFEDIFAGTYQVQIIAAGFSILIQEITIDEQNLIFNFGLLAGEIESFETGDFTAYNWNFGGDANWVIDSEVAAEGIYSARSGDIGDDSTSELNISLDITFDGTISFYRKVSSETSYDYLCFYIDDQLIEHWAGEMDWQMVNYPVTSGEHTFRWSFEKDGSVSTGDDCGWIDNIMFPPMMIVDADNSVSQIETKLIGNYPNPFNPTTAISFILNTENSENTEIVIYNLKGQKIKELRITNCKLGINKMIWNGTDENNLPVSSGIYFYQLVIEDKIINSKKMLLLK